MVGGCRGIFVQKRSGWPARARAAGTFALPEIPPGDRGRGRAERYRGMPGTPPENAAKGRRGGAAFPDV